MSWSGLSLVMAAAGVLVAGYLSTTHLLGGEGLICTVGNCDVVQNSKYAKIGGVPIAFLGLGMYLTIIGLGVARWRRPQLADTATIAAFAIALAGTIYSAYLTYLEIAVIQAICQWCVISAILTLGILITETVGVNRMLQTPAVEYE